VARPRPVSAVRRSSLAALLALPLMAPAAHAQLPKPSVHPEARLDVILGHQPAVQLGAGLQVPMGYYVRVGLDAAVGVATNDREAPLGSPDSPPGPLDGRADLLVRFLLDPFRQSPWGLSLGGGLSARAEPGDHVRPRLLAAVDLEGRRSRRGVVPAFQLGVGGGVRLGVILRRGDRLMR